MEEPLANARLKEIKTPGQIAYEEDVRRHPLYPNSLGPRVTWDQLEDAAQQSWERDPTPRFGGLLQTSVASGSS